MAKMGRPRTPVKILKLHESRWSDSREDLPNNAEMPPFPAYLDAKYREIWDNLVVNAYRLGILDTIDQSFLALYCKAFVDYWKADKKCGNKLTYITPNGCIMKHPLLNIRDQAFKKLMTIGARFGMSPQDRTNLATVKKTTKSDEKDKFFEKKKEDIA